MKTGDNMKEHPQRLELRERIIDTALNDRDRSFYFERYQVYYDG